MDTRYIDFISAYCDRWCERCAFTSRCSAFATTAAIAMCGDIEQGFELALGRPHPAEPDGTPEAMPAWLADLADIELTPAEQARSDRCERAREARIREASITTLARAVSTLSRDWLRPRYDDLRTGADAVLEQALEVVLHDASFVAAKLRRALHGRDEYENEDTGEDPVQNDWNGSAKIALIALDRSEAAWRVIAQATADEMPGALADQVRALRHEVEQRCPHAWSFIRPGFDEPPR